MRTKTAFKVIAFPKGNATYTHTHTHIQNKKYTSLKTNQNLKYKTKKPNEKNVSIRTELAPFLSLTT